MSSTPPPLGPGRRRRKATAALLVVAALAVGRVVTDRLPGDDVTDRPFTVTGSLTDEVALRTGSVRVLELHGAPTIDTGIDGYRTPGLWLTASLRFVPSDGTSTLSYAAVRSRDGRVWTADGRNRISCPLMVALVPSRCVLNIEVAPEALPGAELLLAPLSTDQRRDSMAVIDLGITAEQVTQWQAQTQTVVLPDVEVGVA